MDLVLSLGEIYPGVINRWLNVSSSSSLNDNDCCTTTSDIIALAGQALLDECHFWLEMVVQDSGGPPSAVRHGSIMSCMNLRRAILSTPSHHQSVCDCLLCSTSINYYYYSSDGRFFGPLEEDLYYDSG